MRSARPFAVLAAAALTFSGLAVSQAAAADDSGPARPGHQAQRGGSFAQHALRPADTDRTFYFVMGDRFANGDTSNDRGGLSGDRLTTGFDPTSKAFYNGGDLAGLQSKLDYIKGMGADSIWLTPIFKNKPVQLEDGPSAGYHGYWITDFTQVDPHLGTNAELQDLVDAAHGKGMKVFFDIITNHTADVIGYEEGDRTAYVSKDASPYRTAAGDPFDDRDYAGGSTFPTLSPTTSFPYTPVLDSGEENLKRPAWLNDVTMYHNRGNTTFTGEDSQYGDFFGLDDLFTERPEVVTGMEDIYRTWIGDFGIDGFRIDTMKHVNDEFWQQFGPGITDYAHSHGKPDFFMFGEVALDGSGPEQKAFTSHYSTHDKMQSVLDFPFQDAARTYVSRQGSAKALASFFENDDWYTDADSNAYQLPTFLGNHDMGRFGFFLKNDDPTATDPELLRRDTLAHQLMFLSRGNPIVYYGDEQGFTGTGGDQLARQSMFASQVPEYQDPASNDQIGTARTPAQDNFDPTHPLYQRISRLAALTKAHPALRDGAEQVRYAADGPGIFAVSRTGAKQQKEYVVAFNNAATSQRAAVPTYVSKRTFTRVYGPGDRRLRTDRARRLHVTVPAYSTVVYRLNGHIPASPEAPHLRLHAPAASPVAHSRMRVAATVRTTSFAEVTFQAKVGAGPWKSIGTDDSAPYRVFQDVSDLDTGTPVSYRAAVLDNAGHTRVSSVRQTAVPAPLLTITAPRDGGTVTSIDPVTVSATPDPERSDMTVTFERRVGDGAWAELGSDSSSPVYQATDDVSDLPLGSSVSYRATLTEPGQPDVVSEVVTVTTAEPTPARDHVTLVGDLQSELGCVADWDPACPDTRLAFDTSDGQWHRTFALPEGSWHWKIAINDSWDENYGAGGASNGSEMLLDVPAGGASYVFTWNQVTHVPSVAPAP